MQLIRPARLIPLLALLMVIGGGLAVYMSKFQTRTMTQTQSGPPVEGMLWPEPKRLGEFDALAQDGTQFTRESLRGHWSLLFFGYSYCPDVCPLTLTVVAQSMKLLADQQDLPPLHTVFVTVDPERDTLSRLTEYTSHFHPGMLGVGGSLSQINSLTSQIGIAYRYGAPDSRGNYSVEHTASLFLIDPESRLVAIISPPYTASAIADRYMDVVRFIGARRG